MWGGGGWGGFQGASFLSGGRPMGGASVFLGGGVEKNRKMVGGVSHAPRPTMGNPALFF